MNEQELKSKLFEIIGQLGEFSGKDKAVLVMLSSEDKTVGGMFGSSKNIMNIVEALFQDPDSSKFFALKMKHIINEFMEMMDESDDKVEELIKEIFKEGKNGDA